MLDPDTEETTYFDSNRDVLRVSEIVSQPENEAGTATKIPGNRNKVNFKPQTGFTGTANFEYKLTDGQDQTADSVAEVKVDVQGPDGGCGDIEVSFDSTNGNNPTGVEATPAYDHPDIDNPGSRLGSQKLTPEQAASGQNQEQSHLSWNVPLEVATNTAELIDNYIDPPEGYQLDTFAAGDANIQKDTETGKNFTKSQTTAWLGEDYTPDTANACTDGEDNDNDGDTDNADCNCANGDKDSEASGGSCDTTNICTTFVSADDWRGQTNSSSIETDGDDDREGYERSDGRVTATLDVTDYVGSGETLQSVAVDYGIYAKCSSRADSCSAC